MGLSLLTFALQSFSSNSTVLMYIRLSCVWWQVIVQPARGSGELPKTFTFDNVFDWNSTQTAVYSETAKPIVDSVLEGYNGTVFAYGQTGTGKTHTMDGGAGDSERGIIPKTFDQIFAAIQARSDLNPESPSQTCMLLGRRPILPWSHYKHQQAPLRSCATLDMDALLSYAACAVLHIGVLTAHGVSIHRTLN